MKNSIGLAFARDELSTTTHHAEVRQLGELGDGSANVAAVSRGRQTDHQNDLRIVLWFLRRHHPELRATLRMTDIEDPFVARRVRNIVDYCGEIVDTELVVTETHDEGFFVIKKSF